MPFSSGKVSFRVFGIAGQAPATIDEPLLEKIRANQLVRGLEGVSQEVEYGWVGPRHLYDNEITFENCVFADALHIGLRIDTNKVPGATKKAMIAQEETALAKGNPSGFISKNQKREAKDTVRKQLEQEIKDGKHRRSKVVPLIWNLATSRVYVAATGSTLEKVSEIMERTFGVELHTRSAGNLGEIYCNAAKCEAAYEELRPTRFVNGPEGEGQVPDYPWVAKGVSTKDFLGNEFLLWMWHQADHGGVIKTAGGDVTIFMDKSLELDCAYGQSGRESLRGDGPSKAPEAKTGLRAGKIPRKAYFMMEFKKQIFTLNLSAEIMSFNSVSLPDVEEAESPRVLLEERVGLLEDFVKAISEAFRAFMVVRMDNSLWPSTVESIKRWINKEVVSDGL